MYKNIGSKMQIMLFAKKVGLSIKIGLKLEVQLGLIYKNLRENAGECEL